jgi:hypothetical protein
MSLIDGGVLVGKALANVEIEKASLSPMIAGYANMVKPSN